MSTQRTEKKVLPIWMLLAGIFLILYGLLHVLGIPWEKAWPYLLIGIGAVLIVYALYIWQTGKEIITEKYE